VKYLLDSNTFITAKNGPYGFECVPGFWRWLSARNADKILFSCSRIRKELLNGEGDHLKNWAKSNGGFFLPEDAAVTASIATIAEWVQSNDQFSDAAKQEFFRGADLTLIAHAHAHQFHIVTFEKDAPKAKSKIFIPTVGNAFGVRSLDLYQLVTELKASF